MRFTPPRHLPPFRMIADDLAVSDARMLAHALRVTSTTARQWLADDHAPYAASLALFWQTRWGLSELTTWAYNTEQLHRLQLASAGRQIATRDAEIAYLLRIGQFGAANDTGVSASRTGL